jgi:hypothetical protein
MGTCVPGFRQAHESQSEPSGTPELSCTLHQMLCPMASLIAGIITGVTGLRHVFEHPHVLVPRPCTTSPKPSQCMHGAFCRPNLQRQAVQTVLGLICMHVPVRSCLRVFRVSACMQLKMAGPNERRVNSRAEKRRSMHNALQEACRNHGTGWVGKRQRPCVQYRTHWVEHSKAEKLSGQKKEPQEPECHNQAT